ncbi:MAG TPA: hypothetical protein VGX23_35845 [Actinocrinis sp.]|nr:hypothetical protein [Actinocrinis sp.]
MPDLEPSHPSETADLRTLDEELRPLAARQVSPTLSGAEIRRRGDLRHRRRRVYAAGSAVGALGGVVAVALAALSMVAATPRPAIGPAVRPAIDNPLVSPSGPATKTSVIPRPAPQPVRSLATVVPGSTATPDQPVLPAVPASPSYPPFPPAGPNP